MKKNMNKKKEIVLSVVGLLLLIVITVGTTYAFFNYAKTGTTDNSITLGDSITFLYTEVDKIGNGISIQDAFPISDSQGKLQTGDRNVFNFKITSTTSNNYSIPYEITARMKDDSTLDQEAVKVYLTKVEGETKEEQIVLEKYSELDQTERIEEDRYIEKTLHTDRVPANSKSYEQAYRLRMWIDADADFTSGDNNDKTFTLTVNVYANAKVVAEEDPILASNADIKSIKIGNNYAVKVENRDYDYEIGVPTTTTASMKVETVNPYSSVEVGEEDSEISTLSLLTDINITEEENYYQITVTSEDTKVTKDYKVHVHVGEYEEEILNETDPVLKDKLIPVMIEEDGSVKKVDTTYSWYSYQNKEWANVVILKNESEIYQNGEIIPEEKIESYFVWIPKYSYQIWDLGTYTTTSSFNTGKVHSIPIKFGLENTSDDVDDECTTPMNEDKTQGLSGQRGNCDVNKYMTHPAFISFNVNGFWVGKFETGNDSNNIIIKPNVYSWSNITVGNAFKTSYEYERELESHMMKNTEWGAVAYLSHSEYGTCIGETCTEVRINNNNKAYITGYASTVAPTKGFNGGTSIAENRVESTALGEDGTYTKNYFNPFSVVASTTGNYSGIYDMSGGKWEFVMGYTTGSSIGVGGKSGITSLYPNFFTDSSWNQYYDKYSSSGTTKTQYNNRILGDATGEMGPFNTEKDPSGDTTYKSSWYKDMAYFIRSDMPWFIRGGIPSHGVSSGIFAFSVYNGASTSYTFRVVLAPSN